MYHYILYAGSRDDGIGVTLHSLHLVGYPMLWIYLLSVSAIHLLVSGLSTHPASHPTAATLHAMGNTGSNAVICYYIPCYMYYGAPYHAITSTVVILLVLVV